MHQCAELVDVGKITPAKLVFTRPRCSGERGSQSCDPLYTRARKEAGHDSRKRDRLVREVEVDTVRQEPPPDQRSFPSFPPAELPRPASRRS